MLVVLVKLTKLTRAQEGQQEVQEGQQDGLLSGKGKEGRGLWEQFPGPVRPSQSILSRHEPSVELVMPQARSVTGGFWGQIVEKNKGAEGVAEARSSSRTRTRFASSMGEEPQRSGSSKRSQSVGMGRRRMDTEFDIPDFGVDRMGSLGEDYYEYLDDYGDDLGNLDMVEEQDFVEKPLDNMEAHRWIIISSLRILVSKNDVIAAQEREGF